MREFVTETPLKFYRPWDPARELDFQTQILRCAPHIFPGYLAGPWNPIIKDGMGRAARPDAAFISRDHQTWYVVEVELAHHDVWRHIEPQLDTLNRGIYDSSLLSSLLEAIPDASRDSLSDLVYRAPGRLCIVNSYTERIHSVCRQHDFELAVLEPFMATGGVAAMSITRLPSVLRDAPVAGQYELRRTHAVADKVVFLLPTHFPNWRGTMTLVSANDIETSCKIFDVPNRSIMIDRSLVPLGRNARLATIDPDQRVLRLEVE